MLIEGLGLVTEDLLVALTTDGDNEFSTNENPFSVQSERNFPTALSYLGVVAVVVAFPIKIGFSKKIKNRVTDYNNMTATGYHRSNENKLDFITNSSGIGLRLTLN